MARITPEVLLRLRQQRRLTLDQLAEKSRVDKQTIHRLERGHRGQTRASTLEKLANALGVEPDTLIGPAPSELDSIPVREPNKSQLNLRISGQARNALLLVSERYHVKPSQVVELAPLLFNWAAEKSLRQRQERVDSLKKRELDISEEIERFTSDVNTLTDGPPLEVELPEMDELWHDEDSALSFRYLFSEFGLAGPIIDLLNELVSEIGDQAEFEGWHPDSSPTYWICKDEAASLANGDQQAWENILQGYAPLHELPRELWEQFRNQGRFPPDRPFEETKAMHRRQTMERAEWLRAHGPSATDDTSEAAS